MKSRLLVFGVITVLLFGLNGCFLKQLQQPVEEPEVVEDDGELQELEEKIRELEKQIDDMEDFEIKAGDDEEDEDVEEDKEDESEDEEAEEEPAADNVEGGDIEPFQELFGEKFGEDPSDINIEINKNTGTHVQGLVNIRGEIGGGWFLAAKVDGEWVIAADGNGVVMCDLIEPYDFPSDLAPECWDEETQAVIFR